VPFVRVSRDKRGYETIYLVHTAQRRGRAGATRVLYAFRTPPGVKVGRDPFDPEVRRRIEAQNPGVDFDWPRLSNIPAAPPDVEHWRERRRLEKAARLARKAEELEEASHAEDLVAAPEAPPSGQPWEGAPRAVEAAADTQTAAAPSARPGKRRRRRRGGRKAVEPAGGAPGAVAAPGGEPVPADAEEAGDDGEDVA
jgi:hypothetical protein